MPAVGRAAAMAATANKGGKPKRKRPQYGKRKKNKEFDPNENIGAYGNEYHDKLAKVMASLRDAKWFQTSIIVVIFMAGGVVGIQTYPITDVTTNTVLVVLDTIILYIFVLEIIVKMVAEGKRPLRFFNDAWNCFDFLIVAVGLMPFGGGAVTALRLVRLLRVLKLVRALPKLRILVMGLLKSMSSIAYIGLLLMLLFYLYAVLGVSLFGTNDPVHMGTLHIAFLTLFRCATLEDWTDVMYIAMDGCAEYGYGGKEELCTHSEATGFLSVLYFCSFIILSSMMILNLFIGVITSSMQDAKSDLSQENDAMDEEAEEEEEALESRLEELSAMMQKITQEVDEFRKADDSRQMVSDDNARRMSGIGDATIAAAAGDGKGKVKGLDFPAGGSPKAAAGSANPQA